MGGGGLGCFVFFGFGLVTQTLAPDAGFLLWSLDLPCSLVNDVVILLMATYVKLNAKVMGLGLQGFGGSKAPCTKLRFEFAGSSHTSCKIVTGAGQRCGS